MNKCATCPYGSDCYPDDSTVPCMPESIRETAEE